MIKMQNKFLCQEHCICTINWLQWLNLWMAQRSIVSIYKIHKHDFSLYTNMSWQTKVDIHLKNWQDDDTTVFNSSATFEKRWDESITKNLDQMVVIKSHLVFYCGSKEFCSLDSMPAVFARHLSRMLPVVTPLNSCMIFILHKYLFNVSLSEDSSAILPSVTSHWGFVTCFL